MWIDIITNQRKRDKPTRRRMQAKVCWKEAVREFCWLASDDEL